MPHLRIDECGYTAGQFPKFRDDVFHLQTGRGERSSFLLPTSETAILNVYRDLDRPDGVRDPPASSPKRSGEKCPRRAPEGARGTSTHIAGTSVMDPVWSRRALRAF